MRRAVTVTPGFWLMAALLWVADPQLILPAALAAALHEGGHALALRACRRRISGLRLTGTGLVLSSHGRPLSHLGELVCAGAGPAVSLLAALVGARLGHYLFAGVSLALGLFNLLPIPPLDGQRVCSALAALLLRPAAAIRVSRDLAVVAGGLALGLGLAVFARFGGLGTLFFGLWLAGQALRSCGVGPGPGKGQPGRG